MTVGMTVGVMVALVLVFVWGLALALGAPIGLIAQAEANVRLGEWALVVSGGGLVTVLANWWWQNWSEQRRPGVTPLSPNASLSAGGAGMGDTGDDPNQYLAPAALVAAGGFCLLLYGVIEGNGAAGGYGLVGTLVGGGLLALQQTHARKLLTDRAARETAAREAEQRALAEAAATRARQEEESKRMELVKREEADRQLALAREREKERELASFNQASELAAWKAQETGGRVTVKSLVAGAEVTFVYDPLAEERADAQIASEETRRELAEVRLASERQREADRKRRLAQKEQEEEEEREERAFQRRRQEALDREGI
jgi:hypothetical protein